MYNSNIHKTILLILLVILFYLLYKHQRDYFTSSTRNPIYPNENHLETHEELKDKLFFKYLDRNKSEFSIAQGDYDNLMSVPKLNFKSYDSCPNLYHLFHGFKLKNPITNKFIRGENKHGIKFRNDCERIFYNTTTFVKTEHPIIDIEAVNTSDAEASSGNHKPYQDFEFMGLEDTARKPKLNYVNKYDKTQERFCNFEKELKQIFFGVKSDFSMEDIFRYIDFCFTQLCFGIIYIENMKLTSNHYRVFPCPCRQGAFFILPERIRHQVSMEGKEYTRCKCNTCSLNLIVIFKKERPEKFDFIYKSTTSDSFYSPSASCYASRDIFKESLN